jgi:geranylgeranyl pyrophosphate synthase
VSNLLAGSRSIHTCLRYELASNTPLCDERDWPSRSRPIARACRNSQLVHADPSQILHDDVEMDGKFRAGESRAQAMYGKIAAVL